MGAAADPTSTVVSAALTPMFLVLAAIGAVMAGLWYRGTKGAAGQIRANVDIHLRLSSRG